MFHFDPELIYSKVSMNWGDRVTEYQYLFMLFLNHGYWQNSIDPGRKR